jgi:hypothetical protein
MHISKGNAFDHLERHYRKEKDMARILIFSPYACRQHLIAYEGTIAKACQIRGADVEYILCDGLLPECDMHWDSFTYNHPRLFDLCQRCQVGAKTRLSEFELPYKWLGKLVSEEERAHAFNWAQSLTPSEIPQACFMEYPLGDWVLSTVVSYFRQYPPDMTNWRVVNVYRGFLYSASLVVLGLKKYLETNSVDAALLFNGRQSITRVAFEIFREADIRVLTHEYPFYQNGHLMLKTNARCWSPAPFNEFLSKWGQVPLTRSSLEKTLNWLIRRRYGKDHSWYAYIAPQVDESSIRTKLGLSHDKLLFALFTSSTDETAGDLELQGPYESQSDWVQDTVNWVKNRSDAELVIRVHPHLSGNTGLGRAFDEFNFYQQMKSSLPANIRIVMPDDPLNSYALMNEADVGLTYGSSTGIEMAMLGKHVVLGSRGFYEKGSHILTIQSREEFSQVMEKSLQAFSVREIRREAFRMAYYYVFKFELPFPLVSKLDVMEVKSNYTGFDALAPGRDDSLDHACSFLIDGSSLFDPPNNEELARTTADEDAFFAELEQSPEPFRDIEYEQWLKRSYRLNGIGRSIQGKLERLPFGIGDTLNSIGKAIYLPLLRWVGKRT